MKDKGIKIKETIKQHVMNNSKEYTIVTLLFVIGIFLGVFFVNNMQEVQKTEIESYLNNFIEKMKTTEDLDSTGLLKTSMGQNILLAIMIWFFGTTVIRNACGIWNCTLSRVLLRIHYISMCIYYGNVKRVNVYTD